MTAVPEQRERVSAVMRHLRALGAGAKLGCTVQQAIQRGRGELHLFLTTRAGNA